MPGSVLDNGEQQRRKQRQLLPSCVGNRGPEVEACGLVQKQTGGRCGRPGVTPWRSGQLWKGLLLSWGCDGKSLAVWSGGVL